MSKSTYVVFWIISLQCAVRKKCLNLILIMWKIGCNFHDDVVTRYLRDYMTLSSSLLTIEWTSSIKSFLFAVSHRWHDDDATAVVLERNFIPPSHPHINAPRKVSERIQSICRWRRKFSKFSHGFSHTKDDLVFSSSSPTSLTELITQHRRRMNFLEWEEAIISLKKINSVIATGCDGRMSKISVLPCSDSQDAIHCSQ